MHSEMSLLYGREAAPAEGGDAIVRRIVELLEKKFGGERIRIPSFGVPESWAKDTEREGRR